VPIDASWPIRGPDLDESASRCTVGPRYQTRPTPAYDVGFIIAFGSVGIRSRKGPLLLAESVGGAVGLRVGRTLR